MVMGWRRETEKEREQRERDAHQQRYGDYAWGLPDAAAPDEADETVDCESTTGDLGNGQMGE